MTRYAFGLLLVALASQVVQAQESQRVAADPIAQAERLLDRHQYAAAREAVTLFWSTSGDTVGGDRRARALMLRSVLSESLDEAETDLLRISIEHPQSAEADRALMRLAQARFARGDSEGATTYLQRLVRDHPTSALRSIARDQLGLAPETSALRVSRPEAAIASAATTPTSGNPPDTDSGELTIEIGRFASVSEAEATRDAARAAGLSAYLARVGGSGMTVVRVGSYWDRRAAESDADHVRRAGFRAQVTEVVAR